jgi:hypothetical protein
MFIPFFFSSPIVLVNFPVASLVGLLFTLAKLMKIKQTASHKLSKQ